MQEKDLLWREFAACLDAPTELFVSEDKSLLAQGAEICERSCPVRVECWLYGAATRQTYGVWGGTLPTDKPASRWRRKPPDFILELNEPAEPAMVTLPGKAGNVSISWASC